MEKVQAVEGTISKIVKQLPNYQQLEIEVGGKKVIVENGNNEQTGLKKYRVNDRVILKQTQTPTGSRYFISEYVRRDSLLILLILFVVTVIAVARKRGLASLLGLVVSFLVIFGYILPNLAHGRDPISVAITGALVIIPFTFLLSHGFNRKTIVAIVSTLLALLLTGALAVLFVNLTRLTGFSSDEAAFLHLAEKGTLQMRGLLLAGIIIGLLGVLDDVTVSQSAVVFQLKKTRPDLEFRELIKKATEIGHDHISSMVNTLILVYSGASLPLLLLFINNPQPIAQVVNYELIAEEIVRTLVASIGLIISVPITTLLAGYTATNGYLSQD